MVLKPEDLRQKAKEIISIAGISQLERELEEHIDKSLLRRVVYIQDALENDEEPCFSYSLKKFYGSREMDFYGNKRERPIRTTQGHMEGILWKTIEKYRMAGWGVQLCAEIVSLDKSLDFTVSKLTAQGGI